MVRSASQIVNAPFLRLLLPLCIGVILPYRSLPVGFILLLIFVLVLIIFRQCSFYSQPLWGAALFLSIFFTGIVRSAQRTSNFPVLQKQQYFAVLDEYPVEKDKTFQLVCQRVNSEDRILVYCPKLPQVTNAKPGDILNFVGQPELIKNDGNPFEFNYQRYLNNKDIGYRIFLKENQFCFLSGDRKLNIYRSALIFRAKLVQILYNSGINKENVPLIASISFGARDEVDKEIIQSFTNTGVIHVLAVSGMNVGLIYIILNFLFRYLISLQGGRYLHTLIMLAGIWSYTLITGMSASILRAAWMFTFVVIGDTMQRKSNIYNSLAVSAFFLIFWNPDIIFDVGFQLSYAAVLSIVIIQPFIYTMVYSKNWLVNQIWLLLSVTFAAQIGTIPFTLLYFHQFPVYFWLANLIVIPLVTLILYLSFIVVFLSAISTFLASVAGVILDWSVRFVRITVNLVESLPHAVLSGLYPSFIQIVLVFLIIISFYFFFSISKLIFLNVAILLGILIFISIGTLSFQKLAREEIVFFNIPGTRTVSLTSGSEAVVLCDRCENVNEKLGYYLKPYLGERGIRKYKVHCLSDSLLITDLNLCVRGNSVFFRGIRLFIEPADRSSIKKTNLNICADIVWLSGSQFQQFQMTDYQETKVLLYKSSFRNKGDFPILSNQIAINLEGSVLLELGYAKSAAQPWISCDYFNKDN